MSALLLALFLQATPASPAPSASPAVESSTPAPDHAAASEAPAAEHAAPAAGTTATSPEAHAGAGEAAHEGASAEHEEGPAEIIFHHVMDGPWFGFSSKHLVFLVLVAVLVIALAQLALRSYAGGNVPKGLGAAVESLVIFVRDEVAEPNIGHGDGRKFTPLLCSFFSFILLAALFGLIPGSATSTGNIAVTLGLATVSFIAQQWAGVSKYGVGGHLHNLVPPGMPVLLLPIMIVVEALGVFTKPFALTIRLFANMLAGHMVITTLLLLIPLLGQLHWLAGVAVTPISLALSVFIMLLELLVAFIQAYIFTLLTAIFIGMYAHPAH